MTRPSKIDKLPADIRDKIAAWRGEGKTIDQIMEGCFAAFDDVPEELWPKRSGFGVHIQGLDKMAELVHRSRTIAEALQRPLDGAPESRQARLNIELLHGVTTDVLLAAAEAAETGHPVSFTPKQLNDLAATVERLARARQADQEATFRLRKELAAEQNDKIAAAAHDVGQVAKESGLSAERIAELQAKVAGLTIVPKHEAAA